MLVAILLVRRAAIVGPNRQDGQDSFDMITQLAGLTARRTDRIGLDRAADDPGQFLGDRRTGDQPPPNLILRMIVSATTLRGQALASATGNLGGVVVECKNPNRHSPRPHLSAGYATTVINHPTTHSHFGRAVKLVESLRIAQPGSGNPHGGAGVCAAKLC